MDRLTRPQPARAESSPPDPNQPEAHVEPSQTYPHPPDEDDPPEQRNRRGHVQRAGLAALAANPRLPIWERRIAIALVAGIAVTFIFDWRIGLTVAVLAAISDAIYRSHTTAVTPPDRTAPQRKTERKLEKMASAGYLTLNQRAIPGSDEIIDHLVIGPTGVYAVDSERWDKRLPVRVMGGNQLYHGPDSKEDRLKHARWEAAQASELIGNALARPIKVRPSLAIYGPKIPWLVLTVRKVEVFSANDLRKYLRRNAKRGRATLLSSKEVDEIYAAAARVLPPKYR